MNYVELNTMLSSLLADTSTNYFTDVERKMALNNACSYINGEIRICQHTVDIAVTDLDNKLPIPQDFVSLGQGVTWIDVDGNRTALEHAVPAQLQPSWDADTASNPQRYVMEGSNIYLFPKPNRTGIVRLSYLAMPNKLINDTDLPFYGDPRVQSHHDMIAFYAAWLLCLKDRDFEAAQQFMGYFQTRMIDLKENLRHFGGPIQPVWSDTYSTA